MERPVIPTILTTALARTDRRALSQAWYDALHLARIPAATAVPARHAAATAAGALPWRHTPVGSATTSPAPAGAPARIARDTSPRAAVPDRRSAPSTLARRLERELGRAAQRETPSAFTLALDGGRVRILVRRESGRTHVVALCAPALRERVDRALAHARFALAAGGTEIAA